MTSPVQEAAPPRGPDAYADFAPLFERLSAPLATVLRGLLDQFEALGDDLSPPQMAPHGEIEGLGGVTRRGDIDRVVTSELLLRTEAPTEFLRRFAEGEMLHHETVHADPAARSAYRVVVSVGPGSLGHGRFVALAALIFLARLAALRGADFHWCFLPHSEGPIWFDTLSVNNAKRFLRAASYREASDEDVAAAGALWSQLTAESSPRIVRPLDWVIGASARSPGRPGVTENAANGLAFELAPPSSGQPRTVTLGVRRLGRTRRRIVLTLPDDGVCLGALRNPFRPPPRTVAPNTATARSQGPEGWAQRYLINASADMKLVRLADGLLLLRFDAKQQVTQSVFMPLDQTLRLAGVRLYREGFMLVLHAGSGGAERLALGSYQLPPTGAPSLTFRRLAKVSSAHLFKQQPAYVLPSLTHIGGVRLYSSSGMAFQLVFGAGEAMTFEPLYQGPRIIASNGVYEVLRIQGRDTGRIEVLRPTGHPLHSFQEGSQPLQPPALRAMIYNHNRSGLAYSLAPNRWRFARLADVVDQDEDQLILAPHERLIAGHANGSTVSARIWSDARYGGDGEIRGVRLVAGERTTTGSVLKLGRTAADTVAVDVGDDGVVWAVTADRSGAPDTLIGYRKHKSGGGYHATRYDLGRHREKAELLDLSSLHD